MRLRLSVRFRVRSRVRFKVSFRVRVWLGLKNFKDKKIRHKSLG